MSRLLFLILYRLLFRDASDIQVTTRFFLMKFGYVWIDPRAISEAEQHEMLDAAGCDMRRIVRDKGGERDNLHDLLSILRPDDVVTVVRSRYVADDVIPLLAVFAAIARAKAYLHVIDIRQTSGGDAAMSEIVEDFVAKRRKKQTAAAREAFKRLPKGRRGGPKARKFTDDEMKKFKLLRAANASYQEIAEALETSKTTVARLIKAEKKRRK